MNRKPNEVTAKYYFGIKPTPRLVQIDIQDQYMSFMHPDTSDTVLWDISKVLTMTYNQDHLILRYGLRDPFQYLELDQSDDIERVKSNDATTSLFKQKTYLKRNIGFGVIGAFVMGLILLLGGAYFYALPSLNQWAAKITPKEWEIKMGNAAIQQFLTNEPELAKKSMILNQFFDSLRIPSVYPIKLYFIDDTFINAFAMPGGHIVVYKGIVDRMCSYQELVGLLGHEFVHIEKQHSLKTMYQAISSYLLISMIFGDLTGIAAVFVDQANNIKNLSYSRSFELESDREGVDLMVKRQINPQGMLDLFKLLHNARPESQVQSSFFSTHPLTEERIQLIESKIDQGGTYIRHPSLETLFTELQNE